MAIKSKVKQKRKTTTTNRAKGVKSGTGQKRKRKAVNRKTVLQVKQGVRQAVYGFYTISLVFLILILVSLAFLVYQWKDYQITEYVKDIQHLKAEILRLDSEKSRYQAKINSELMTYYRIARVAEKELGLKPASTEPLPLRVDKKRLAFYVQKDTEEEKK